MLGKYIKYIRNLVYNVHIQ